MKKNIAVVGCGYWGKNLVRNFHEIGALNTVCDVNERNLEQCAKEYSGLKLSGSYAEVLADTDITGVVIATPAVTHYALAKEGLDASSWLEELAIALDEGEQSVARLAEHLSGRLDVGSEPIDVQGRHRPRPDLYRDVVQFLDPREEREQLASDPGIPAQLLLQVVDRLPDPVDRFGSGMVHEGAGLPLVRTDPPARSHHPAHLGDRALGS